MAKNRKPETEEPDKNNGTYKRFEYYLAWISVISAWLAAVIPVFRNTPPPDKDEFYK